MMGPMETSLKGLCHRLQLPGPLLPVALSLHQATADHASAGDPETLTGRTGSDCSWGGHCSFPWVLVHSRFCLCPLRVSDRDFDFKHDCVPPTFCLWLLLCPWTWDIFLLLLCLLLFFSQLFVRPPQTTILPFAFLYLGDGFGHYLPYNVMNLCP